MILGEQVSVRLPRAISDPAGAIPTPLGGRRWRHLRVRVPSSELLATGLLCVACGVEIGRLEGH